MKLNKLSGREITNDHEFWRMMTLLTVLQAVFCVTKPKYLSILKFAWKTKIFKNRLK